jgi:hypothetical protein
METIQQRPAAGSRAAGNDWPPAPFGFKQYLKWCLPALILGALLRLGLMAAAPEAYFGSDSASYFQATDKLWKHGHHFVFKEKRRWIYPMLCLPLPILPWSPAKSIALLQHLLGLGIIAGVGWIVAHLTKYRAVWVPLITMLVAIDLELLREEHELIGDSVFLAAIIATAAIAMPPGSLRLRRRLFWFLIMAAVVAAIKPHGRGIWLGSIVAAMVITGNPWRWKLEAWAAIAAGVAVILSTGEKRQANWLLLNSTLPLVNLEGAKWSIYRQALKPTVLKARQDFEQGQYAWTERVYKKAVGDGDPTLIDPVWAELAGRKDDSEYLQVCKDLAMEAIAARPFAFAKLTLTKIGVAFAESAPVFRFNPAQFWKAQDQENTERWSKNPEEMRLYYGIDQPGYERLVEERSQRQNVALPALRYLHDVQNREPLVWVSENRDPATGRYWLTPGCLGVLAAIGLGFCLRPSRFAAISVVWLPAILLMLTVFAVGDSKLQYVLPVRWAWLVVMAVGLDGMTAWACSRLKGAPQQCAPEPVAKESQA